MIYFRPVLEQLKTYEFFFNLEVDVSSKVVINNAFPGIYLQTVSGNAFWSETYVP